MKTSLSIVRWLPVVLVAAACAEDVPTAPVALDESLLVTAQAGKSKGQDGGSVMEPMRFIQRSAWPAGLVKDFNKKVVNTEWNYRRCFLNSYEDRDGNDFSSLAPDGSYVHNLVNEKDGFVLIYEGKGPTIGAAVANQRPVALGRSTWDGTFWVSIPVDPDGEIPAYEISVNSKAQGVAFPIEYNADGSFKDPEVALVMNWLNSPEADSINLRLGYTGGTEPGSYGPDGTPQKQENGYDLLNDPLGIVFNHPDPSKVGTVGRAVRKIDALLKKYQGLGRLVGTNCDADYGFAGFQTDENGEYVRDGNGKLQPASAAQHNEIYFSNTWPSQLERYFR